MSYSLNPNLPQSNYTVAPVTRATTNATPPAVAKPVPATEKEDSSNNSMTSPKNLGIGVAALAALTMVGLGIRNRNWKFWEDAVSLEKKNLENTAKSLEAQVTEKADEMTRFKSQASQTGEVNKPSVVSDIGNSHKVPLKADSSERWWGSSMLRHTFGKQPDMRPAVIPQALKDEGFTYTTKGYKQNGSLINPLADKVDAEIWRHLTGGSGQRQLDLTSLLRNNRELKLENKKNYLRVINEREGVVSYVPLMNTETISHKQMSDWVKDGLFVLPNNQKIGDYPSRTSFSIPKGGFPHAIYRNGEKIHQFVGFLVPNP